MYEGVIRPAADISLDIYVWPVRRRDEVAALLWGVAVFAFAAAVAALV
jgi:hypothetical protein